MVKHVLLTPFNAGGVLDRADSYLFTGALAYNFVKTFLPVYGVWHETVVSVSSS